MTELAESTGAGEMIAPMTVDSIDQRELAEQLPEQAREQNIELVGLGGLLGQLTKSVLATTLPTPRQVDAIKHAHLTTTTTYQFSTGAHRRRIATRAHPPVRRWL